MHKYIVTYTFKMSLKVLCVRSIMDNNLDYTILSYVLQEMIDYEMHKIKFKDTLYILDTVKYELDNVDNFLLTKVQPVFKEDLVYDVEDEKYNFIFVKYLYYNCRRVCEGTRFIQELNELELD